MSLQYAEAEVKAYCPCQRCCGEFADGKTTEGGDAYARGLAVPSSGPIPKGALVCVPGYGWVVVDDTGGRMNRWDGMGPVPIEVRFPTHEAALEWGKQFLRIAWVKESPDESAH